MPATSRKIMTASGSKKHQKKQGIVLNLENSAVFSVLDDKVVSITSFSKDKEISDSTNNESEILISKESNATLVESTGTDLNSNETSQRTSTLKEETPVDRSEDVSFVRNPSCHVTYPNKHRKYSKHNRNSIQIVDYPPSLYEKNALCLNKKLAVDLTILGNTNESAAMADDTLISGTVNPLLPKIMNYDLTLKSEKASDTTVSSKEMPVFSKSKKTRPCTELFYKKMKRTDLSNNCDVSLPNQEPFDCFPNILHVNSPKNVDQYPVTSKWNVDNPTFEYLNNYPTNHEELCKMEFCTVDPLQIIERYSHNTYVDSNLSNMESEVEIVPVFHDDESLSKFEFMLTHVKQIELSALWSYTLLPEKAVIFIRWNETYDNIIKYIFISTDFKIKVYVHKILIKVDAYEKIDRIESVRKLINIVENIPPCNGFGDGIRRSENCKGFVSSSYRNRPLAQVCIHCKLEKKKIEKEKEKQQSLRRQLSEIRLHCKQLMKENSLLCKHLESCCGIELKSYIMETTELDQQDINS